MKSTTIFAALALSGVMTCGPIANASDTPPATPTPPPAADAGTNAPAHPNPAFHPNRPNAPMGVFQQLDLSADQTEKVKPLIKERRDKLQAMRQEGALTQEERFAKLKEISDGIDAKLKTILTPEQFTKYQELSKRTRGPKTPKPSLLPTTPPPGAGASLNDQKAN